MILVVIIFIILLMIGMPVSFSIAISGVIFFLQHPELPISTIVQLPISNTQNVALLAVPLFVFAGNLMNSCGITSRFIKLSMQLVGHMKGGMAQVSVVMSTLMGGCSGSSNADAAMEARIEGPEMERQGYPKGFSAAVIGYTSLITSTIPPSIGMVLYGTVGEVSIGRLFAAGIVAGLIMMFIFMLTIAIIARVRGFKPLRETKARLREIFASLKETIWALIFPFVLLGSLRFGLFTPTEIGAFSCVYALVIGFFVYKELNYTVLIETLKESIRDIGAIMYMITMSAIFGYGIPLDKIPQKMIVFITEITTNPILVMVIIVLFLILFGMFMEGSIIIILLTPIFIPLVKSIGVDLVLFGVIVSVVVTMGILTPPVGVAMYIVCGTLDCKLQDFLIESIPFLFATLLIIAIYMCIPNVILFLPNLLYG
jgi:tripartite ATP-independent transporter DctM subunit